MALCDRIVADDNNIEASSLFDLYLKRWVTFFSRIEVNLDTIDKVMSRFCINKIDVEAAEEIVLQGSKNGLSNGVIAALMIEPSKDVMPPKNQSNFFQVTPVVSEMCSMVSRD